MSTVETGGQAFPIPDDGENYRANGMTLRDYFAAKAMQGLMPELKNRGPYDTAAIAYEIADAMIAERGPE